MHKILNTETLMSMLFYDKFTFLNVEANPPWIMILLFYPTSIFDFSSEWKSHLLYNIKCVEMKFCTPLHEENVWEMLVSSPAFSKATFVLLRVNSQLALELFSS